MLYYSYIWYRAKILGIRFTEFESGTRWRSVLKRAIPLSYSDKHKLYYGDLVERSCIWNGVKDVWVDLLSHIALDCMQLEAMHLSSPSFWFHSGTYNVAINVKVGEKGKRRVAIRATTITLLPMSTQRPMRQHAQFRMFKLRYCPCSFKNDFPMKRRFISPSLFFRSHSFFCQSTVFGCPCMYMNVCASQSSALELT